MDWGVNAARAIAGMTYRVSWHSLSALVGRDEDARGASCRVESDPGN